jgi:hypothetical protein
MDVGSYLGQLVDSRIRTDFHWGVITDKFTSPYHRVTLTLSGSTVPISNVRYLASYTPTIGDVVFCVVVRGDIIVLGELQ